MNRRSFFGGLLCVLGLPFTSLPALVKPSKLPLMKIMNIWMPGNMANPYLIIFTDVEHGKNGYKHYNVLHNDGYSLLKPGNFYCEPLNWNGVKRVL